MSRLNLIALKAYGDFVIACQSVRSVGPTTAECQPSLIASEHLLPLASALGLHDQVTFIAHDRPTEVPAAFDVRRRGLAAAARSLVTLRSRLAALPSEGPYVFDRLGWRERFIAPTPDCRGLRQAANIYAAYAQTLSSAGLEPVAGALAVNPPIRSAAIVPASRIDAKTIPPETIGSLCDELRAMDVRVDVALLEGEEVVLPSRLSPLRIPRRFDALISFLRGYDLIVSADSLAAHLAEYERLPSFVVSPRANTYWLPPSCLQSDGWCTFQDAGRLTGWLLARAASAAPAEL